MTHQADGDRHTPACSAFFVPGEIVHAWRRNQKVIDLDRPDAKQVGDKVLSLERAIERDTVPPPDKQMIVARKLGEFLTSKKARDVGSAIAPPVAAPASSETSMSEDERVLSEIPMSYRSKAKKLMRAWSQKGMTWDDRGNIYLKGKAVRRGSLAQLLHHASSGRCRNPPIGFGHVTRYMPASSYLPQSMQIHGGEGRCGIAIPLATQAQNITHKVKGKRTRARRRCLTETSQGVRFPNGRI